MLTRISENAKAIVALIMALLVVLDQVFALRVGISEEVITIAIAAITPILVWLVPNHQAPS